MANGKDIQLVKLEDVEGFQHAQDNYWYRPLIFSDNLFTYVAHIPPRGEMPAHEDSGHDFDTVLYMLKGNLHVTFGKEQFDIEKNMALFIPGGVPFGVRNDGNITASYVLTFNPPPDIESLSALKEKYQANGREFKTPLEMETMVGGTLD